MIGIGYWFTKARYEVPIVMIHIPGNGKKISCQFFNPVVQSIVTAITAECKHEPCFRHPFFRFYANSCGILKAEKNQSKLKPTHGGDA